jgi:hypothetical protein
MLSVNPPRWMLVIWALPTTLFGLLVAPLAIVTGGGMRVVDGVVEIHGGVVRWLLLHATLLRGGVSAMTLGHVVLGLDRAVLEHTREHERVHVRQCERWGPFFIPVYLLASLWVLLRGGDGYRDNPFEREAFAVSDCRPDRRSGRGASAAARSGRRI